MDFSLTNEQEQFVNKLVESGQYSSANDVIREGLRLLEDRYILYQARLAQLQKEINVGIEASLRGEVFDGEQVFAELDEESEQISPVQS